MHIVLSPTSKVITVLALMFLALFTPTPAVPPSARTVPALMPPILTGGKPSDSWLVGLNGRATAGEISALEQFGAVSSVSGKVVVVHTDLLKAREIRQLPFVESMESPSLVTVQLDKGIADVGAVQVWDDVKDKFGYNVTGRGVVVGFVDTGIDWTHPDFYFPNGTSKILYIDDQSQTGSTVNNLTGTDYVCTRADIEAKNCLETDSFGHGTHVAGIAASSGMAPGHFQGVAPDAYIIMVKSGSPACNNTEWGFDTGRILDGIEFIADIAASMNMRAVVSLSLGGDFGGHDGSSLFEQALDEYVALGVPIVVAAGNSAAQRTHAQGAITSNTTAAIAIKLMPTTSILLMDIWYPLNATITASINTPAGQSYSNTTDQGVLTPYGVVFAEGAKRTSGNEKVVAAFANPDENLTLDGWSVSIEGSSNSTGDQQWNAWAATLTCSYPGVRMEDGPGYLVSPNMTVGVPGTAFNVITVGAYTTKNSWTLQNGTVVTYGKYPVGPIAFFSGVGPTRDGRIKPDVVAPGLYVASARSKDHPPNPRDPDPYHTVFGGTSMAAPHVAGVIALMLQLDPTMDPFTIRDILRSGARLDQYTGLITTGSPVYGFGKLDARTAAGLTRLTIVASGLPAGDKATMQIDGKTVEVGAGWTSLYFQNRTHDITVEERAVGNYLRWLNGTGEFHTDNSTLMQLHYTSRPPLIVVAVAVALVLAVVAVVIVLAIRTRRQKPKPSKRKAKRRIRRRHPAKKHKTAKRKKRRTGHSGRASRRGGAR